MQRTAPEWTLPVKGKNREKSIKIGYLLRYPSEERDLKQASNLSGTYLAGEKGGALISTFWLKYPLHP
ncbi:MAG: hypothetical protein ACFFBV_14875 [Promethearchaeota archaeon]